MSYPLNREIRLVQAGTRLGPYEVLALLGAAAWAKSGGRATRGSGVKSP